MSETKVNPKAARIRLRDAKRKLDQIDDKINNLRQELDKEPPTLNLSPANVVVVDCLPIVKSKKLPKLVKVIEKLFGKCGKIVPNGVTLPQENDESVGCAFVEYVHPRFAAEAVEKLNNLKLDSKHILRVNPFAAFDALSRVSEEYQPPPKQDFKAQIHLYRWLLDKQCRDQYAVRYGDLTEVYWNDADRKPQPFDQRNLWTEAYFQWSPRGTYFATLHEPGVMLWGGEQAAQVAANGGGRYQPPAAAAQAASAQGEKSSDKEGPTGKLDSIMRFQQPGVKYIDFSPCERYMVTFSPQFIAKDNELQPRCVVVWDVRTGARLRGFPGSRKMSWPFFSWSTTGRYLACRNEKGLAVYEAPGMHLLNNKSLEIKNLRDYCWSPTNNILAYWALGEKNLPASVTLLKMPNQTIMRSLPLLHVTDCKLSWHPQGRYLSAKVDRHTKSKKNTFTNFQIFSLSGKNVGVQQIEYRDPILAFAWEPRGTRFAVCHGSQTRPDITFHKVLPDKVLKVVTLKKTNTNHLFWSPAGRCILMAGMRTMDGHLVFYDVDEKSVMQEDDHFGLSSVHWDPSGRYIATCVSAAYGQSMENGYNMYTFQGRMIQKVHKDQFFQFQWRPRPPSPLSRKAELEIEKNLPKIIKEYQKRERDRKLQLLAELEAGRNAIRKEFHAWEAQNAKIYAAEASRRAELWSGVESYGEDGWEEVEYIEEIVENQVEEVVGDEE